MDELYWDVNGDQWQQQFQAVNASVVSGVGLTSPDPVCYTGFFGDTESTCSIATEARSFTVKSDRVLNSGETLTFVAAFSKGYFEPMPWLERYWPWILTSPLLLGQVIVVYFAHPAMEGKRQRL